jgi:hypothetical protein
MKAPTPRSPKTSPPAARVSACGSVEVVVDDVVEEVEVVELLEEDVVDGGSVVEVVVDKAATITDRPARAPPSVRKKKPARIAATNQSPTPTIARVRLLNRLLRRVSWGAMALSIIARPLRRDSVEISGAMNSIEYNYFGGRRGRCVRSAEAIEASR